MSNGHSWSNVKYYTLSEIGVFISSIYVRVDRERIDKFSMGWMSNNLTQEGMEQMLKNMTKASPIKELNKPKSKEEVGNEWMRLASFKQ